MKWQGQELLMSELVEPKMVVNGAPAKAKKRPWQEP